MGIFQENLIGLVLDAPGAALPPGHRARRLDRGVRVGEVSYEAEPYVPMTGEEVLSLSTARGWSLPAYFVEGEWDE